MKQNGKPIRMRISEMGSDISQMSAAEMKRHCDEFFKKRGLTHTFNSSFGQGIYTSYQKPDLPKKTK
jgi:hypothetical protein